MVSKRKANLDLDWEKNGDDYVAQLPGIPYYTDDTGNGSFVTVTPYDFYGEKHWKAVFTIIVPDGNVFKLNNGDLNLMGRDTADEMMEEVESLRDPGEITYALYMEGYPSTESFPASRKGKYMMRKATRRTASMNLDWVNPSEDVYQADLPAIPGYTEPDGNESFVTVTYDNDGGVEAVATIFPTQGGVVNLDCWSILEFIPQDETLEDVMQAFDDLDVYDFSYELDKQGIEPMVDDEGEYVLASRHATRRAAGLGELDWEKNGDDYVAQLPAIPGYQGSYPDEVRVASRPKDDDVWLFEMLISVGDKQVPLYNYDFGIPYGGSADEMMDAVENLNPQDIASVLEDFGFAPEEGTTAGRHAMRRKADMNLDWEQDDVAGSWFADLPAIPGYPCADGYSNHVQVADQSGLEGTDWAFYMYLELQKETIHLYNEDFDIPDTDTAEEMMDAVENLDPQDIADALAAKGYMPDEE